jgi:CDP-diacylglycerol pyrophosphatase
MRRRLLIVCLACAFAAVAFISFATWAFALDRQALWQVVRACVADARLTGAPFPCLKVDLTSGEEQGYVVLAPPFLRDMILAPTRKIVGVEDPFLQSAEAPNYFEAAWRARSFLVDADGKQPERDQIAVGVNSGLARIQDQLHIHIGCLTPAARRAVKSIAPKLSFGEWTWVGPLIPHTTFWAYRIREADLAHLSPFRLAADYFGDRVRSRGDLMILVSAARVADEDEFLILASYAHAPRSWWPVGAEDLLNPACPTASASAG